MYNFIDVNEVSEAVVLPSEALQINGEYIENLIPGYRTLTVSGREALTPELTTFETGVRDGSVLQNKRFPARTIRVAYQLIAESNEAFREAYNQLASILNVSDAELIFNDEPDKFFKGTPSAMSDIEPGRNSVLGEFEIFCADPFKYSVIEYEAEPDLSENSILINYNGTYKAYPTLEAEFYNEEEISEDGETEQPLTGSGDCGYVAFFNEKEKIIQLGDPNETDTEYYANTQTLVNQGFQTATAWGTIAQKNWPTNSDDCLLPNAYAKSGSVKADVASWLRTTAPTTSGTLLNKTSKAAKPYINYTVTAQASGRTANSVNVKVTFLTSLNVVTVNSGSTKVEAGAKITLKNTKIYISSTASSAASTKTGTYYLWDGSIKSNRIRITNTKSNVGKSGQVVGWVNVSDISLSTTTTTTSSGSLGKGYGLKGGIQFSNGSYHYVTLKSESAVWKDNSSHKTTITIKVSDLNADTEILENIKFKVERTDDNENNVGILDETACNDLEISLFTAPVPSSYYLVPETFGSSSNWHGPSITRKIPADAAGNVGAKNFTFSYRQKLAIGSSSSATQELGGFQVSLVSDDGSNRKIIAGAAVIKNKNGKNAYLQMHINGKRVYLQSIDLSLSNKYFGNNTATLTTVKTSTITKSGKTISFNIGGVKKIFNDNAVADLAVTEITFQFAKYGTKPELSYNGLYWAKFIKNNCDTYEDIVNKFSSNDVVVADCKNGEVLLNDMLTPSLGALGNDWEDFYLEPGLNQIGFSYSSWVGEGYAPKFKVRYREVFI